MPDCWICTQAKAGGERCEKHAPRYVDERIVVWPDGDWCWESDLPGMTHKSDDYQYMPPQFFFIDDEI